MSDDVSRPADTVLDEIQRQSVWCETFGSPFTAQLLTCAAADLKQGGIVAKLTDNWSGNPRADAVSLRIAAALHAATLTGRDEELASHYPAGDPGWSMDRVWPLAEGFLRREEAWVRAFMTSPPQTNETGRATGLAACLMWLALQSPEPFHMLEIGASAGLNLNWDRFRYAFPPWNRRSGDGPLIPTQVAGPAPPWRDIAIASREACDLNPLDPSDPENQLRLRAYVWADQKPRFERLNAALDLAQMSGLKVEKADAAEFLRRKLGAGLKEGTTVVYHSVFFQYPPPAMRIAIAEAIERAGTMATATSRLAWVRFEPEAVIGGPRDSTRYVLNVVRYGPDGRMERTLGDVDPHGRTMSWEI